MPTLLTFLPLLAPLALLAVAVLAVDEPGRRPRRVLFASRAAALTGLVVAIASGIALAVAGPASTPLLGADGFGLALRLDALSATLFILVAFIGAIVVQYSRNYLDGDDRQGRFLGDLCLTLAAVMLLVLSGNLVLLVLAWIGTNLALQRLLLFYPERIGARVAARKKAVVSRLSELCVAGAALLLVQAFGTADIAAILAAAQAMPTAGTPVPGSIIAATVLLAVAALLTSAQFPTHGWLPEVMETPTPVSALLHAGIVNAGGFLVVRFADVMLLSAGSLHLLALVGGFTALFACVAMLTQTSVKVSLAWSTVAQMGFMLLQCGLGAFAAAVLHIVAHSLYKAHAFLASGSVVEIARGSWVPTPGTGTARPVRIAVSLALALGIFLGVASLLGVTIADKPAIVALGAILTMGLTHLLAQGLAKGMDGKPNGYVIGRTALAAAGTATLYVLLQAGAQHLLGPAVPATPQPDAVGIALMGLAVGSFALVTLLQLMLPGQAKAWLWARARVHVANGLYANALFDQLTGALVRPAART